MYTKEQVMKERRCGLKIFDKAVIKSSRQAVIDKGIEYYKENPDTWGPGWPTVDWAIGNAMRDIADNHGPSTFNLDEALTDDEMKNIASLLNITDLYVGHWKRK